MKINFRKMLLHYSGYGITSRKKYFVINYNFRFFVLKNRLSNSFTKLKGVILNNQKDVLHYFPEQCCFKKIYNFNTKLLKFSACSETEKYTGSTALKYGLRFIEIQR